MEGTLATVMIFAGNFNPRGWAYCSGQLLPIAQNQALFSLIGTIYGGDGRTTFQLPDLRGRVPIGAGQGTGLSNYRLGMRGGQEMVTLNTLEIPSHTHGAVTTVDGSGGNIDLNIQAKLTTGKTGKGSTATNTASGNYLGDSDAVTSTNIYRTAPNTGKDLNGLDVSGTGNVSGLTFNAQTTVQPTGSGQGHENRQPWLAINYVICLQGVFPSRS